MNRRGQRKHRQAPRVDEIRSAMHRASRRDAAGNAAASIAARPTPDGSPSPNGIRLLRAVATDGRSEAHGLACADLDDYDEQRQTSRRVPNGGELNPICPVCEERRNAGQNAAQWPILQAWAKQKQWPVNGSMTTLTDEEWKDILTAAFEGETSPRISPGLNGGMVMLGRRTSRYGKRRFSEWLDWLNAASHHAGIKIPAPESMIP